MNLSGRTHPRSRTSSTTARQTFIVTSVYIDAFVHYTSLGSTTKQFAAKFIQSRWGIEVINAQVLQEKLTYNASDFDFRVYFVITVRKSTYCFFWILFTQTCPLLSWTDGP